MRLIIFGECDKGLKDVFADKGFEIIHDSDKPSGLVAEMNDRLEKKLQDSNESKAYVFTHDYYPVLSQVCFNKQITYISWVWDCPHMTLWSKTVRYNTNRIFVFDYVLYETLLNRNVPNVNYLPLAVDVNNFKRVIEEKRDNSETKKFNCDVAFVGNLYNDKKSAMYDNINFLPQYVEGFLDALMNVQKLMWGADIIDSSIPEDIWEELKKYIDLNLGDTYEEGIYEVMVKDMIKKKVSQLERLEMCSLMARISDFSLFTGSDTSYDPVIQNKGRVDYHNEMPLVFHNSKINLHITIRPITSGISQRVLDVLGCEGFLITNYQPEIAQYFENGKELVMFESMEDLCQKVLYYLEHDDERKQIAHAGYLKVKEQFNYESQISKMLEVIS